MAGLYIHIPFCASRCIYCGFYSTVMPQFRDDYIDAVCKEMTLRRNYLPQNDRKIHTLYIGGGTPSLLLPRHFDQLFEAIHHNFDVCLEETTVEVNPDDVTTELAQCLHRIGVDRVSMGAQTFNDDRLHFLRRRHHAADVKCAIDALRKNDIENISIDLMFGFPNETANDWRNDLNHTLALDVPHISAYSLMYEEGTPLYRLLQNGKIEEIDEELSLQMYDMLTDTLVSAGYRHYEISNFARPGYEARHNSSYWHDIPYIGLGTASHSYCLTSRQWNVSDIHHYISAVNEGRIPMQSETIDAQTHYDDLVTTALRTSEGLDLSLLTTEQRDYITANAQNHLHQGNAEITDHHLRLTRKGLYISDLVMSDLMMV